MKIKVFSDILEHHNIIWFPNSNRYLVLAPLLKNVLLQIDNNTPKDVIVNYIMKNTNISQSEASEALEETTLLYKESSTPESNINELNHICSSAISNNFIAKYYYKINNCIFEIAYCDEFLINEIHLKFEQHCISEISEKVISIKLYKEEENYCIAIDDKFINKYTIENFHYLQGKLSMELIKLSSQTEEEDWLGVFHASAVAYNNNCAMLLGDSGNGKSTALALLYANGFDCVADDFVPIDTKQYIHPFPAAISVKENSLKTLAKYYHNIDELPKYTTRLGKVVTYLPQKPKHNTPINCNTLVFIKYQPNKSVKLDNVSKTEAFQELVPDSWISSKPYNVEKFINWFRNVKCYRLIYSKPDDLIDSIKNIMIYD